MFFWRFFSSILLIGVALAAFLLKEPVGIILFLILGVMVIVLGLQEISVLCSKIGMRLMSPVVELFSILIFLNVALHPWISSLGLESFKRFSEHGVLLFVALFGCVCWMSLFLSRDRIQALKSSMASCGAMLLLVLPLCFLAEIYVSNGFSGCPGSLLALYVIFITKSGDIGAYCVGTLSSRLMPGGNHKITPETSPKKSWEGTLGGLAVAVGTSVLMASMTSIGIGVGIYLAVGFGVLAFALGFYGDICESALKRAMEVKDSGQTIPGIGGTLDLVDSLLLAAPVFYAVFSLCGLL